MEPLKLIIEVMELNGSDAPMFLGNDSIAREDLSFYRCRIELNGKSMQMQSPLAQKKDRHEMLMGFIGKAWAEISTQAFPPSEATLIISG